MVIKREVACGIVRGLTEFWKCEELQDFTVTVGDVQFGCHRLLLAACSDFFRALFRSGMKEVEQNSVTIKEISSEIFELIMKSMYTGNDILTNDNVIDIWRAAHQLQIHFLVSECENFAIKTLSLENYIEYLQTSKALNSNVALRKVWSYILKNCNSFFQTSYFLEISISEFQNLIKSQNLVTNSEDDVIHAILKWAELSFFASVNDEKKAYSKKIDILEDNEIGRDEEPCRNKSKTCNDNDDNVISIASNNLDKSVQADSSDTIHIHGDATNKENRCKNLTLLLSHARTCLASRKCLEMLVKHPLVRNNKEAKDIVIDTLLYQVQVCKTSGQWPLRAVHRNNSDFKHCMVDARKMGNDTQVSFYVFAMKKWFQLPGLVNYSTVKLAAVDRKLYAICTELGTQNRSMLPRGYPPTTRKLSVFLLKKDTWLEVENSWYIRSDNFSVAVVESLMYIVSAQEKTMWKLDTDSNKLTVIPDLPPFQIIYHVMPYDQSIIVFLASINVAETGVGCYDTSQSTWTKLNNLQGPGYGMTSFIDDQFTYLLQSNGNLWKVGKQESDIINFEFVVKLWECDWQVNGAVTFMNELYIHGAKSTGINDNPNSQKSLPGVFSKINYLENEFTDKSVSIPFLLDLKTLGD